MGLDITAYSKVEKMAELPLNKRGIDWERACELEETFGAVLVRNDHFPTHCEDLDEAVYKVNGESYGFRAGSYSGYNRFRNLLSAFANTMEGQSEDLPFYKLIHFSDCGGCIGPRVSARLHKDFVENKEHFLKFAANYAAGDKLELGWIEDCYLDWTRAFELAKDHGFVHFH